MKDTDGFWKIWSDAVERGYLKYLDEKKEFAKVVRGRGEITILEQKGPGGKGDGEEGGRIKSERVELESSRVPEESQEM